MYRNLDASLRPPPPVLRFPRRAVPCRTNGADRERVSITERPACGASSDGASLLRRGRGWGRGRGGIAAACAAAAQSPAGGVGVGGGGGGRGSGGATLRVRVLSAAWCAVELVGLSRSFSGQSFTAVRQVSDNRWVRGRVSVSVEDACQ